MTSSFVSQTSRHWRGDLTLFGFVAATMVAAALVVGTYWVSLQQTRTQNLISHTHEVLETIATTRADLLEIQNSVRAFVITGREQDLQPYLEARQAIRGDTRR